MRVIKAFEHSLPGCCHRADETAGEGDFGAEVVLLVATVISVRRRATVLMGMWVMAVVTVSES